MSQGSWEILNASIMTRRAEALAFSRRVMTRRAEALAFSRRVIPRTGKIHDDMPPHIDGILHDIFGYLARFYDS